MQIAFCREGEGASARLTRERTSLDEQQQQQQQQPLCVFGFCKVRRDRRAARERRRDRR